MTEPKQTLGRPPTTPRVEHFTKQPLYVLLVDKLPDRFKDGHSLLITDIAKACGVQRASVYRWFNELTMSAKSAKKIIEISEGNLTSVDIIPFMLRA